MTDYKPYNPHGENILPQIYEVDIPNLQAQPNLNAKHYYVPATKDTIQWGFFSKNQKPLLKIKSGDYVTMEVITQQACDAKESMIEGDIGSESIFYWEKGFKSVQRRGPGPHICTGPLFVEGAEPGDIIEVKILDMLPRYCQSKSHKGRFLGVNVAATWGYNHGRRADGKDREVVTVFEIFADQRWKAKALYSHQWGPFTDPDGTIHKTWDYPGLLAGPTNPSQIKTGILKGVEVPLRPHFGVMGLAPPEIDEVSTTPPGHFGGNIDNWRVGKGGTMFYPVGVAGGLLSVGDAHAAQGDSECCGTAIESSWTGTFQIVLHKQADTQVNNPLNGLTYPLLETDTEYIVHGFSFPNYLTALDHKTYIQDLGQKATLDNAFQDAYFKARDFIMKVYQFTEDETVSLMSVAVDFVVTQVVDANLGVHAVIKKSLFNNEG